MIFDEPSHCDIGNVSQKFKIISPSIKAHCIMHPKHWSKYTEYCTPHTVTRLVSFPASTQKDKPVLQM